MEGYYLKIDDQEFPEGSFTGMELKAARPDVLRRRGSRTPGQPGYQPLGPIGGVGTTYTITLSPKRDRKVIDGFLSRVASKEVEVDVRTPLAAGKGKAVMGDFRPRARTFSFRMLTELRSS